MGCHEKAMLMGSVQFSRSVGSDSETPWTTACQASLSITTSWSAPKPMSIKSVMPSNHLILRCPLLLLPSIFPSIRVFSNESALHIRWPKYWSFSFNISPSNEHLGLISFRMDWLDLLAVQGTLKSLLQYHSSKASILLHSVFSIVQLSHPYRTTGKTITLTRWTLDLPNPKWKILGTCGYWALEMCPVWIKGRSKHKILIRFPKLLSLFLSVCLSHIHK